MPTTHVQRELFPDCSVAAILSRIGQGIEWSTFLNRAFNDSLINWVSPGLLDSTHISAVIGHASSFASLQTHISTFAANSYSMSSPTPVDRQPFVTPGAASGRIKKQSSSADQFAFITLRAEPTPDSEMVQLSIPQSDNVADELHDPAIPDAILDGVCLAALAGNFAQPFVGFHVAILEAIWHTVDSYAGVFKRAAYMAMSEILSHNTAAG